MFLEVSPLTGCGSTVVIFVIVLATMDTIKWFTCTLIDDNFSCSIAVSDKVAAIVNFAGLMMFISIVDHRSSN